MFFSRNPNLYSRKRVKNAWLALDKGEVGPGILESLTKGWRRKLENELKKIKEEEERIERLKFTIKQTKNINILQGLLNDKIKVKKALNNYKNNIKLLESGNPNFFKIQQKTLAEQFPAIYYLNNNKRNLIKKLIKNGSLSPNNWNTTMGSKRIHDGSHGRETSIPLASAAENTIASFMNKEKGNRFRLDKVENSIRLLEHQINAAKFNYNQTFIA